METKEMLDTVPVENVEPVQVRKGPMTNSRKKLLIIGIVVFIFILLLAPIVYTAFQIPNMKATAETFEAHLRGAYAGLKNQDLVAGKSELENAKASLEELKNEYAGLAFWKYTLLHWHYRDGERALSAATAGLEAGETVIDSLEPYADVIGFKGQGSFLGGTAEDRIVKVIETIEVIAPNLDQVEAKLAYIDNEISGIDPKRYPVTVRGQNIGELISTAKTYIHQANTSLKDIRPVIENLPKVAGVDEPKTYLVLFQNDGELRPTGGFMTAYAILKVDKGKVIPEKSDDIYELDAKFKQKIPAPPPIKTYLKNVNTWNLRDMNLDPDFRTSMETFLSHYNTVKGEPKVDGVISVDTKVLTNLISVLGPVEVPGYGSFSSDIVKACDCAQVVHSLENMITRPTPYHRSDRKGVLGPLMQTILQKAYGAPKQTYPALFQTVIKDINEKHILFYFTDPAAQQAAETINVAGRMREFEGDYFHVNDANFGGAKSNIYVTQEVDQEITVQDGKLTKVVTIAYKNPRKSDNCNLEAGQLCLNGKMPTFTRVYLPKGSELKDSAGFNPGTVQTNTVGNFTVVEGYFELNPESQAKVKLTYTVPYNPGDEYKLLIQKQPGTKEPEYRIKINDREEKFDLTGDRTVTIKL